MAAYCRDSTGSEQQQDSLDAQLRYYAGMIHDHPDWMEAGVFSDTGSGIKRKERHGFQRMMASCRRGKIDLIITKSVTRFGRNIPVMLRAFDELRGQGVDILFETEGLNLLRQDTRILLKLYAAFAEEESITKSEITKWGIRQGFRSGDSRLANRVCYGYRWDQDGKLTVAEQEALVVRTIFQSYLEGKSLCQISRLLEAHGIPSPSGNPLWNVDSIRKVLRNEKYTGDVLLQKTFVANVFDGRQVKNQNHHDQYRIHANHGPIITQDRFDAVQCLLGANFRRGGARQCMALR